MKDEKKLLNSPFSPKNTIYEGSPVGDTVYYDKKIYRKYVETGVEDYIDENGEKKVRSIGAVQTVVIPTKTDIQGLINSHADEVGLDNLIKMYLRTGDASLFNQRHALPAGDYSQLPTETAEEIFEKLPEDLVAGRSMEEFLKTLTDDQLKAYFAVLGEDGKKDEVNEEVIKDE